MLDVAGRDRFVRAAKGAFYVRAHAVLDPGERATLKDVEPAAPAPSSNGPGRRARRPGTEDAAPTRVGRGRARARGLRVGGDGFPFRDREGASTVPLNSLAAIDSRSGRWSRRPRSGSTRRRSPRGAAASGSPIPPTAPSRGSIRSLRCSRARCRSASTRATSWSDRAPSYVASGPTGQLVEIDPKTNEAPRPQSAGKPCDGVRESIALGQGSLWLACDLTPSAARISLASRRAIPIAPAGTALESHYSAVAFGAGTAWIADSLAERAHRRGCVDEPRRAR